MKKKDLLKLIVFILVPLGVGFLSSFLTIAPQVEQYREFIKPDFFPPSWVFGPVWTALYIMMGVASFLVYQKKGWGKEMWFYSIQLVLNFAWTGIFFGAGEYFWAFVEIIALWILILITLVLFYKTRKLAGILFIPYLLWVSYASVLNYYIFTLN